MSLAKSHASFHKSNPVDFRQAGYAGHHLLDGRISKEYGSGRLGRLLELGDGGLVDDQFAHFIVQVEQFDDRISPLVACAMAGLAAFSFV